MEDMMAIRLVVEGMKREIVKAFDVTQLSEDIKRATEEAVAVFDVKRYIESSVKEVLEQAKEQAVNRLAEKYSGLWSEELEALMDRKIKELLK